MFVEYFRHVGADIINITNKQNYKENIVVLSFRYIRGGGTKMIKLVKFSLRELWFLPH